MSGMPTVYSHLTPKARKPHQCLECRGVIPAGEQYHLHKGIWDGEADTFKICADCNQLMTELTSTIKDRYDDGIPFGGLWEYIIESRNPELSDRFDAIQSKRLASGKGEGK